MAGGAVVGVFAVLMVLSAALMPPRSFLKALM
jgi:hypothetical protein